MKLVALGLLSLGVFLLMQVISPFFSFQIWQAVQKAGSQNLVSPTISDKNILGVSIENSDNFSAIVSTKIRETQPNYDRFYLTVSKLKLDTNAVFVDSNNLNRGLAHLPGSALPGEKGNVFISGHSAVSRFLTARIAPFAKLADLKIDDEIMVEAADNKFVYKVINSKVVEPTELSVINPPEPLGRYITLMTCVPPGLNYKRLVVIAKMI